MRKIISIALASTDVDTPSMCANCGCANCVEISQVIALKPSALRQVLDIIK
jgi:hypothetical protein